MSERASFAQAAGTGTIIPALAGHRVLVEQLLIACEATAAFRLESDGASPTDLLGTSSFLIALAAGSLQNWSNPNGKPIIQGPPGEGVDLVSTTADVAGIVVWRYADSSKDVNDL